MLFFSNVIGEFNKGFANLLGLANGKDEQENDGNGQEENGGDEDADGKLDAGFLWLALIKEFSDITKETWGTVWTIDIYTFFNTIAFSRKWHELEKKEMEKWRMK